MTKLTKLESGTELDSFVEIDSRLYSFVAVDPLDSIQQGEYVPFFRPACPVCKSSDVYTAVYFDSFALFCDRCENHFRCIDYGEIGYTDDF